MNVSSTTEGAGLGLNRQVLSKSGVVCSIIALAPGENMPCADVLPTHEHLVFVIDGTLTVLMDETTYLLNRDEAMHIPSGREVVITADTSGWAKLLWTSFAPREIVVPPIFSFPDK